MPRFSGDNQYVHSPLSADEVAGVIRTALITIANHGTPNLTMVEGTLSATAYMVACVISSGKAHEHAAEIKAEIFERISDDIDAILRSKADA